MNTIYDTSRLKTVLEAVVKESANYCYYHHRQEHFAKLAKGDFYTRLRRHMMHIFGNNPLEIDNVDTIYVEDNGTILYIGFLEQRYSNADQKHVVARLNELIEEINPNFSTFRAGVELDSIIESVKNFEVK